MAIDLATATSTELKQWKKTINWDEAPPGALDELNELIIDRSVSEQVTKGLGAHTASLQAQQRDEAAYRRWPELRDPDSPFAKKVKEMAPESGKLMDAANEVGFQLYGAAGGKRPPMGIIAPGRTDGPITDDDIKVQDTNFLKETSKLRAALVDSGLIKNDAETITRITARAREVSNASDAE